MAVAQKLPEAQDISGHLAAEQSFRGAPTGVPGGARQARGQGLPLQL
jgi:hypothetical protein